MAALGLLPAPVRAHEYWLSPSSYRAGQDALVTLSVFAGTGFRGELKPYAAPRTRRFELRGPKTYDLSKVATNGDVVWARFRLPDDAGTLLAYESDFAEIELPAGDFDRYLRLEGLDEPLARRARLGTRAGPGRERYARCAKAWIAGRDLTRLSRPIGMPLEVIPLADPTRAATLRVRVLFEGRPLADALVRAWNQPLAEGPAPCDAATRDSVGPTDETRTDGEGVARLSLRGAGEWLINSVHMIPSRNPRESDWESYWASLTFAKEGPEPRPVAPNAAQRRKASR